MGPLTHWSSVFYSSCCLLVLCLFVGKGTLSADLWSQLGISPFGREPKLWQSYYQAFLHNFIKRHEKHWKFYLVQYLQFSFCVSKEYKVISKSIQTRHKVLIQNYCSIHLTKSTFYRFWLCLHILKLDSPLQITEPAGKFIVQDVFSECHIFYTHTTFREPSSLHKDCPGVIKDLTYVDWDINLVAGLWMQFSFHVLDIPFGRKGLCDRTHSFFIHTYGTTHNMEGISEFVFCGFHSPFTFFPKDKCKVTTSCTNIYNNPCFIQDYHVNLSFSVIDNGTAVSFPTNPQDDAKFYCSYSPLTKRSQLRDILNVIPFEMKIASLHLVGSKMCRINVNISSLTARLHKILCFDGPDMKSEVIAATGNIYLSSSYQAFVILLVPHVKNQSSEQIDFCFRLLDPSNTIFVNQTYDVKFSSVSTSLHTFITHIVSPSHSDVKLTMKEVVFFGPLSYQCVYGGIAILKNKDSELISICQSVNRTRLHRHIYASSHEMYIVVSWYSGHGNISVHFHVNTTECHFIHIEACIADRRNPDSNPHGMDLSTAFMNITMQTIHNHGLCTTGLYFNIKANRSPSAKCFVILLDTTAGEETTPTCCFLWVFDNNHFIGFSKRIRIFSSSGRYEIGRFSVTKPLVHDELSVTRPKKGTLPFHPRFVSKGTDFEFSVKNHATNIQHHTSIMMLELLFCAYYDSSSWVEITLRYPRRNPGQNHISPASIGTAFTEHDSKKMYNVPFLVRKVVELMTTKWNPSNRGTHPQWCQKTEKQLPCKYCLPNQSYKNEFYSRIFAGQANHVSLSAGKMCLTVHCVHSNTDCPTFEYCLRENQHTPRREWRDGHHPFASNETIFTDCKINTSFRCPPSTVLFVRPISREPSSEKLSYKTIVTEKRYFVNQNVRVIKYEELVLIPDSSAWSIWRDMLPLPPGWVPVTQCCSWSRSTVPLRHRSISWLKPYEHLCVVITLVLGS